MSTKAVRNQGKGAREAEAGEVRPGAPAMLGELTAALAGASDDKLARIITVLESAAPEAVADRGIAEALIAPLRPRLALSRPRRRPGLSRLVFSPLDPVIVPASRWGRESIGVPRTVLGTLWTAISAGLGPEERDLRLALATLSEPPRLGAVLWPRAAAILREAAVPGDWQAATGLETADHAMLTGRIAAILAGAPALAAMEAASGAGGAPSQAALAAWLAPLAEAPKPILATGIAILLARLPQADSVMALAEDPARVLPAGGAGATGAARAEMAEAVEAAIGFVLHATVDNVPASGGDAGADAARQAALLLLGLEARAQEKPQRLARIRAARHQADARLRAAFAEAITAELAAGAGATQPDALLEESARALRRFAGAARHLGSAASYDAALRAAAAALTPPPGTDAATCAARARLVEILAGSEAAAMVAVAA
jgi:hypothetical protein